MKQIRSSQSARMSMLATVGARLEDSRRELEEFGNLFVKDIHVKDVQYGDSNWLANMSSEHVTLLHVSDAPAESVLGVTQKTRSNVSCLVLPPDHVWPSFSRKWVLARRVVVLKSSPLIVSTSCEQTSIPQLLLNGNQVALVGHSGVGKSTELDALWPELFQILREKKITTLYYRSDDVLYKFTYEGEMVRCAVAEQAGETRHSLRRCFDDAPENIILVLDRDDDEVCNFHVPAVVSTSLCDEYYGLKTWQQSGGLHHCDRPPHTPDELSVMCAIYYELDRDRFMKNLGLNYTHTLADALKQVQTRIAVVGPLPREVLGSESKFWRHKTEMKSVLNPSEYLKYVGSGDSYFISKYARYFLAPDADGKMRILSPYAKELMLESAKEHNKESVARKKYSPSLAAAHVLKTFCLLDQGKNGTQVCDAWNFNKWEYYHNPGPGAALQPAHALNESERAELISDLTRYKREAHFASSILHRSFDQLDENCVYSSTLDNVLVGRFFMINKEQKRLTLFLTSSAASPRQITVASLMKWLHAIRPSKITIVYCTDWTSARTKGVKITEKISKGEETVFASDAQVSQRLFNNDHSFSSYVVRCGLYDAESVPRDLKPRKSSDM